MRSSECIGFKSEASLPTRAALKKSVLVPVLSVVYLAFLVASVLCVIFEW